MDSCTLERALSCSARFPTDTVKALHSSNALIHAFRSLSRLWKLFLSAWWINGRAGLDIALALTDGLKVDLKFQPRDPIIT